MKITTIDMNTTYDDNYFDLKENIDVPFYEKEEIITVEEEFTIISIYG